MNTRRLLIIGCAAAILAGLIVGRSAPSSQAGFPASEHYRLVDASVDQAPATGGAARRAASGHYRLVASGIGDLPAVMQSDSYVLNEGVVLPAEIAPPTESENYQGGGEVPQKVFLPLVLKSSG